MSNPRVQLGPQCKKAQDLALVVGALALIAAVPLGYSIDHSLQRFFFAYLVNFAFFLSISLGALFFVLLQHVTRAGWSTGMRRIAEILAAGLPAIGVLAIPIAATVLAHRGVLYPWANPEQVEISKAPYLNPAFFVARLLLYFVVWSGMGIWFWRKSVSQDISHNDSLSLRMQAISAPSMVIFGITLTFAAFDLLMSVDPVWFSTIFGVYFFSGCAVAIFATLILAVFTLQRCGYLPKAVTIEHYHDLGKLLFGFTFFWGYIAFSQYMLLWYANMPETSEWFAKRGATTVARDISPWTTVSLLLLFGQLLIPFVGLLSRHVKRAKGLLVFWAVWLLVFHWVDLFWLIMPALDGKFHFGLLEPLCLVGMGGIFVAVILWIAQQHSIVAVGDPRLHDAIVFENI
jgi:hypothetical protein